MQDIAVSRCRVSLEEERALRRQLVASLEEAWRCVEDAQTVATGAQTLARDLQRRIEVAESYAAEISQEVLKVRTLALLQKPASGHGFWGSQKVRM